MSLRIKETSCIGHEPTETNYELSAEYEQELLFPHLRAQRREGMGHDDTKENRSAEIWAHNSGLLFPWGHLHTPYVLSKLGCFVQLHTALDVLGTNLDERFVKKKRPK